MQIDLTVVDGETVVANAAVTRLGGQPMRTGNVRFSVDGKAKKVEPVNGKTGVAIADLGHLKPGEYTVTAEYLGAATPVTTTVHHHVHSHRRPTTGIEWIATAIFLILALKFGYTALTVVGLFITMGVLFIGAVMADGHPKKEFMNKLKNNNWVFYTMLWLFLFCLVMFLFGLTSQPLPEVNPFKIILNWFMGTVTNAPADPYAKYRWGPWLTSLLLGNEGGWFKAMISFLIWTLIAYPVSFWDDYVAKRKERKEHGQGKHSGGLVSWLWERFVNEGIGEFLWSPFRNGNKKH